MYENENMENRNNMEAGKNTESSNSAQNTANSSNPYFDYMSRPIDGYAEQQTKKKKREKKAKDINKQGVSGFAKFALTVSLGLCFGACAGVAFWGVQKLAGYEESRNVTETTVTDKGGDGYITTPFTPDITTGVTATQITYVQDDISDMVDEVMPAMVSIVNNYTTVYSGFFGQNYKEPSVASGSGIIVGETEEELLIATNNHVIENTDKLEVTFIDGNTAEAIVKGTDAEMDLAVIAVAVKDLSNETKDAISVSVLGDSDNLRLGEPVVAIGNALGYGQSVTNGIVSALNREIESSDGVTGTFIQTNAAINPGNSGGALLNLKGEVIGINSSKIGGSTIEGMGYAIPISSASPILSELMVRETRVKVDASEIGYMGITMQSITSDIADAYGFPKGVFIREVEEGSPAEKAGMKKGDIIVKFDGQKISSNTDVQEAISYFRAGDTAEIIVKRSVGNGEYENVTIQMTFGARPE